MSLSFINKTRTGALEQIAHLGSVVTNLSAAAEDKEDEFYYRDAHFTTATLAYIRILAQANMIWHGISQEEATNAFLTCAVESGIAARPHYSKEQRASRKPCHDMRGVLGVLEHDMTQEPAGMPPNAPIAPRDQLLWRAAVTYSMKIGLSYLDETYTFSDLPEIIGYLDDHIDYFLGFGNITRDELEDYYESVRTRIPYGSYDDFDCVLRSEAASMQKFGSKFYSEAMQMMGLGKMKGVIVPVSSSTLPKALEAALSSLVGLDKNST